MTTLLSANHLTKQFTGLLAVNEVDVEVTAGSVHGIIGPNGAGKTTLFNLISGLLPPTSGTLTLDGHDVTSAAPYQRTRLGVARTFQNIRMFSDMTVVENVMTGMHTRLNSSGVAALLRLPGFLREERDARNNELLLRKLGQRREAYYYCIMVLLQRFDDPRPLIAEGLWRGEIARAPRGTNGFGYDPLFRLPALGKTAAELDPAHKNRLSHRGQALQKLLDELRRS